jgi:phosphatidylinositol alpha-1,6-mannosyltransferase
LILALQTTTFGAYGGIPTYNRLVCRVLNETVEAAQSHILIATDKASDLKKEASELPNLRLEAFGGSRRALASRAIKLALTRKFDLMLMGHVNYAPLGWLLKRLQPQLCYGVVLYGIEAWQQLPRWKRQSLQQADFLISISDYTKRKAHETNALDPDRIYLLPNALEWKGSVHDASLPGVPAFRANRLLSVCRLDQTEKYKGVDKVIEALPTVLQSVPDIQYIVVGGGTDLVRHQQLAETLGVSDHVQFPGYLADDELRARYRDCDLFVMPSAGEGFGFVFLEAMKYGKTIVAARSGGAPEVVRDGITGRLVEYGDQEQLAQTLIDLCLNAAERERLGEAGHDLLQQKFTFPHFKQALTEILLKELPAGVGEGVQLRESELTSDG